MFVGGFGAMAGAHRDEVRGVIGAVFCARDDVIRGQVGSGAALLA